jgi:hypothetical protein
MVRLDTGKPGAHAGAEMRGSNFGKEVLNFGWLRLGFGAGFGGFLQLAETLDPHLPQEFPPAGEMRRGGNTHCELKIVVGDFEKSWNLKSNLVIVTFLFPLEIEQVGTAAAFRLPCPVSLLRSD